MGLEHVPRCQHVKVNGVQCGSPALRQRTHCYFHTRAEHERRIAVECNPGVRSFGFPLLEDANSIQVALMKIIQMLGSGTLDHKTAGLMIYALQTASYNMRHARLEPEKLTEVVIDEDTVDITRIEGPQWSAADFSTKPAEPQAEPHAEAQLAQAERPGPQHEECVSRQVQGTELQSSELKSELGTAHPIARRTRKDATAEALADLNHRREQKRNLPLGKDGEPPSFLEGLLKKVEIAAHERLRIEKERTERARAELQQIEQQKIDPARAKSEKPTALTAAPSLMMPGETEENW